MGGSKRTGAPKDYEKLVRAARKQGWTVTITGGNHLKWVAPDGDHLVTSLTPRRNDVRPIIQHLRKKGTQV